MSKRLGGIKGCKIFKEKSERYITSRNGWVSLKGISRWYICRRDPSTYQNTPGPSGHTNVYLVGGIRGWADSIVTLIVM